MSKLQSVPQGYKLRKGQVYTWQEVMDWVERHSPFGWSTEGPPLSLYGEVGVEIRAAYGDDYGAVAAFLCASSHKIETEWTCTYVAPEYALPPLHYYSICLWNKDRNHTAVFLLRDEGNDVAQKAREKMAECTRLATRAEAMPCPATSRTATTGRRGARRSMWT